MCFKGWTGCLKKKRKKKGGDFGMRLEVRPLKQGSLLKACCCSTEDFQPGRVPFL